MPRKKPDLKLVELVEKFAATKKSKISPSGYSRYLTVIHWVNRLCPDLLVKDIKKITIDNLEGKMTKAMESDRKGGAVNPKTVKSYLSVVRAAICWHNERIGIPAPTWKPESTGKTPKRKPKSFTPEQVVKILEAFKRDRPEFYDYTYFLLSTALRPNELNSLSWDKVSVDYRSVVINSSFSRGVSKDSTKTGVERKIYLAGDVSELLKNRPLPHEGLIFVDGQGRAIDDRRFRRIWQRLLVRAGIPYLKPYCTRSSAISLALNSGADPVKVAAGAGHDPVTMFKYYGDLISKDNPFVSLASLSNV